MIGLLLLLIAAEKPPAPEPVPWAITGTSSIASIPVLPLTHRIERRWFQKDDRWITRAGFTYLSRGDLRVNPGIALDLGWYPSEVFGVDVLSGTVFFSSLTSTARTLRESTGLLPDSQKPIARVMSGARYAFAYGKVLVESLDVVLHFDASALAHLGVLITDRAPNPGGDLGLSLQLGIGGHLLLWMEAAWMISYESRSTTNFASGPIGTLGFAWIF